MASSRNSLLTKKTLAVFVAVLTFISFVLVLKHLKLKYEWISYSAKTQNDILEWSTKSSQEEGMIIATTASSSVGGRAFYRAGKDFENYIKNLSLTLDRDIVVMDKNKTILADTVTGNIGKKYNEDQKGEVLETMADAMPRTFLEKGMDYPQGIMQTVVAIKDSSKTIIGAVVLSSDKLSK